ncbi:DUF4224 domain-containing protein [Methylotenera versatilis]|uniref:DUF4224 domain-containing protein n=1 Tax=Methylotenera versatilis TaxID=1055487 RepID=UPI000646BBF4|nr:DUF4224 domain-containing protein [Methylotenera versatilis]
MSILSLLFLTQDELKELTDLKNPSAQIRWLINHSYPFETGASGKPKVLRSLLVERLRSSPSDKVSNEPNFDAIR